MKNQKIREGYAIYDTSEGCYMDEDFNDCSEDEFMKLIGR